MTIIDILHNLKLKGYKAVWNGNCNIAFEEEYNFTSIPKGFIFKDNKLIQVFDIKLNNKEKQNKRDVKVLDKWVKSL